MQVDNRLVDDLARMAAGAAGALAGVRREVRARLKERLERLLAGADMVAREEFDAAHAMAAKARAEQEDLAERLAALEVRLAKLEAKPRAKPKRPAKRRA